MDIRIGIDPAFRVGGFRVCIFDKSDRTMRFLKFSDLIEFYDWLKSMESPAEAICIIENSNLQNVSFDKRGNRQVISRKSRNVGANQAVSQLTVIACRNIYGNDHVKEISPLGKGRKLKEGEFKALLKSQKITSEKVKHNQDDRDAGILALKKII